MVRRKETDYFSEDHKKHPEVVFRFQWSAADGKPFDMFYEDKVKRFKEEGIEYTIRQIDEYRALGVDGIHLYALNKWKDVSEIIDRSGLRTLI